MDSIEILLPLSVGKLTRLVLILRESSSAYFVIKNEKQHFQCKDSSHKTVGLTKGINQLGLPPLALFSFHFEIGTTTTRRWRTRVLV
jgi:hypothetical protein